MKIPEFNLLDEKWIQVLKNDCSEELVSLPRSMIHAHEYRDLSGDTPEQDMAVLRLLLAVLHTVFSSVDQMDRQKMDRFTSESQKRWRALWRKDILKKM